MKNRVQFKHSILLESILVIFVFSGICMAQVATYEKGKAEVLNRLEEWYQTMRESNTENIIDFFPKDGKTTAFRNRLKMEQTGQEIKEQLQHFYEKNKYSKIKMIRHPDIYIAKDGNTAWVYYESEFEYHDIKTKKENTYIAAALEILVKENGNWVFHTSYYESLPAERETTIVENDILDEYTGKYQSSVSGNTYTVTNDGKNLIFVNDKNEEQTIFSPESETVFFNNDYPQSLIFCRDRQGKISHYVYAKNGFTSIIKKIK